MRIIIIFIFSILLFSCASKPKKIINNDKNVYQLSLQKGPCFGTCPIYKFYVYENGYCEFYGELNTKKLGKHGLQLSHEKHKLLINAFKSSRLDTFESYYESDIPDLPIVVITCNLDGKTKSISGKSDRPKTILKLQTQLEEIAESQKDWFIIDGSVSATAITKYDKTKFIISFSQSAQITRWFNNSKKAYGIRILKQVSNNNNWIISYNPKTFTPEEMLGILNNDTNITSAEFLPLE